MARRKGLLTEKNQKQMNRVLELPGGLKKVADLAAKILEGNTQHTLERAVAGAKENPEFRRRLVDELAALLVEEGVQVHPWFVRDATGLEHTPGYHLCRTDGDWIRCPPVVARLIEALNDLLRRGFQELAWHELLDVAAAASEGDPILQAEIRELRKPPTSGATRHKRLNRLFARAGVWNTLVGPGVRKGSYRLILPMSHLPVPPADGDSRTVAERSILRGRVCVLVGPSQGESPPLFTNGNGLIRTYQPEQLEHWQATVVRTADELDVAARKATSTRPVVVPVTLAIKVFALDPFRFTTD